MAEKLEQTGKTFRTSLESLVVNVTSDELKYRNKYLPDPRRLMDEKIVCTVCSLSLASRVRKGKDLHIHAILGVLVCKDCYNFYGDGIFSCDEDGEDKYCRWCGQGGHLYLCSNCNCGFCKKCMMKNMKNSALEAIERDDWKCLICVPRPIFGSRAVCWASKELNSSVRKNNQLKLRLEEEKSKLENVNKFAENGEEIVNPCEKKVNKTRKRVCETEDSDSSSVFIPTKKSKQDVKSKKKLNESFRKHKRKKINKSTSSDLSDEDSSSKWEQRKKKRKRRKKRQSSSTDESFQRSKMKIKKNKLKNKSKTSSDDSSDSEKSVPEHKNSKKKNNKYSKNKRKKKKSTSSSSESVKKLSMKHPAHNKKSLSDSSSEDENKSDSNINQQINHEEADANHKEKTDEVEHDLPICSKSYIAGKESENDPKNKNQLFEKSKTENSDELSLTENTCTESPVLGKDLPTSQKVNETACSEELPSTNRSSTLNEGEFTLGYRGSTSDCDDKFSLSQEDEEKMKVHLAIEWLNGVSSDIADLGSLIAERTSKFGKKKINLENLHSYDDVVLILEKLGHLLGGIHSNYKQIEDDLDDKLKSWKILVGLEKSDLDEQLNDVEDGELQTVVEVEAGNELSNEADMETQIDGSKLHDVYPSFEPNKDLDENLPKVDDSVLPVKDKSIISDLGIESANQEIEACENHDIVAKHDQNILETGDELDEEINKPLPHVEPVLAEVTKESEPILNGELEKGEVIVNTELNFKSGSLNKVWSGLLSSDDSDPDDKCAQKSNTLLDNGKHTNEANQDPGLIEFLDENREHLSENQTKNQPDVPEDDSTSLVVKLETTNEDTENFKALQELLYSSTEPEIGSSENDSDDSEDFQLDDSDLEDILSPRKLTKKKSSKQKEKRVIQDNNKNLGVSNNGKAQEEDEEGKSAKEVELEKKPEEPLDSEAEIDMLTDLSKLKKKTVLKRVDEESGEESSSEESQEDGGDVELDKQKKRRKTYNNEVKKRREQERNELFGFLEGDSSAEDEADITKKDLDVMEDQYASESSSSMSLKAFSRKMAEKWQELEKEQDQLNLQMLLASESEGGSVGGDDLVLESDDDKKKKKENKIKDEKSKEDEACMEKDENEDAEVLVKDEKEEVTEPDDEYEQFLGDLTKARTTFTGLGSSSEEDKMNEEIDIKEEILTDDSGKVKKESKGSNKDSASNSDSSSDLFLDITKKSEKKSVWRQHKLLRMKLSDTDTSDEERWWQRRLEREKKKKEQGDDSSKKTNKKNKEENLSDKENKKIKKKTHKEEDESNSSSTLEISSSESSGSEVFKKKKKKKRESSDSDIMILSEVDNKKKKKKKKFNLSGDSSNESEGSNSDVIDITQKTSQGESPGKGGRKNIRKVLTKHELAAATKAAAKEEEERKKRIAARQKLFNEMFEIKEAEILEKLVLDFDPETKTELISVDKDLVTKMKPHQAKGVKFMWDSCFESLSQLKTKKGSGCILAHCMGLGKTFQVVSLVHTILTHKDTNVRTVLVVCPLSTVLNWYNEFDKWLEDVSGGRNIKIYHLTKYKKAHERSKQLSLWQRTGGVMILGYELFRILANPDNKKFRLIHTEVFQKTLIDPGADLVVCDEGHMLKNESTLLSKAMSRIRTLRRIVLTGTPMQNNLKEYHCMVQFVKPNLLGTRKEFLNQFVNPITNGQFVDSTEADVKVMKRRAHVLHKMLEGLVQRCDYSVLTPFLPPKHEYVISLRLSDVQVKLYQFYLDYFCKKNSDDKRTSSQLFQDWQVLGRVWTHPRVLKMGTDKAEKERQQSSDSENEPKKLRSQRSIKDFFQKKTKSSSNSSKQESEDEGSIKDFVNDKSSSSSLSLSSSLSSDDENGENKVKIKKKKVKNVSKVDKEEKKAPVAEEVPVEPVDEINLISSEEEADTIIKEVEIVEDIQKAHTDEKAHDSGIEDHESKSDAKLSAETDENANTEADDKGETEDKGDEKKESKEEENNKEKTETEQYDRRGAWWKDIVEPQHHEDINQSAKLILLFAILRECEMIEDKVLVFSQSLFSLDLIEYFLEKVDKATEENRLDESLGNHAGCWQKGLDYFRLDGSSSSENRSMWCKSFNKEDNPRARLFLISTRAGGLGINLTGANRVVIFDASWNPSHDIQSIFRIYRFGQKKACYVYRFVAHGTMEEKVYERQVAKQLLSSRVVDEQQVQRHFSMNDLNELYTFTPPQERTEKPTPVLPKDKLMAELLTQYNDWIEKYHEHDSLLENIVDEELNEEERKLAWEDYENEKKRGFPAPTLGSGVPNFHGFGNQIELFRKSLRLKFPNATEAEMNAMLQTLMYQVNYRAMTQQVGAQQLGQAGLAGPSQQQPPFKAGNSSNLGSSQSFNQMFQMLQNKNKVYSKPNGTQPIQQQRMATNQINQQRISNGSVNRQMIGNGQIRKTNKERQDIYLDQMRKQQEANYARIQNQKRIQQQQINSGPQRIQQQQNNPNLLRIRQQQTNPSQQNTIIRSLDKGIQRVPVFNSQRSTQPINTQIQNQQGQSRWKPNQPVTVPSRVQKMQNQPQNANKQVVASYRSNLKPITQNPQQQLWKTPKQKMQEEMQQRIKRMQEMQRLKEMHQKEGSVHKTHSGSQKSSSFDPEQQRRLEEMKKRYEASRSSAGSSAPISIVEIEDEPGT